MSDIAYLLVNFGGPRTLDEVEPFLRSLLTDKDVVSSRFPQWLHNRFFGRIAKKRARTTTKEYEMLGGGSPIWQDTEYVADALSKIVQQSVYTFHRYLPSTHQASLEQLEASTCSEIRVFPMFPQFTYATTGSIARFFREHLSSRTVDKCKWVKSYPQHPAFVRVFVEILSTYLQTHQLREEEVFLLFSAHGLPQAFVDLGDIYAYECARSYQAILRFFPQAESVLCYQSKFGPGEWLKPYTTDVCASIATYTHRKNCVFIPLSFTSDHIETLIEMERLYMPVLVEKGYRSYRLPAFNRHPAWIRAIVEILGDCSPCTNEMLIR